MKEDNIGLDYMGWTRTCSEHDLLRMGKLVAGSDYAVAHYLHPWHKKFFGQRAQLEQAVRRALSRCRPGPSVIAIMGSPYSPGSGQSATELVLAGAERVRQIVLSLSDADLDRFLCEIAYGPTGPAEAGDQFLDEFGYEMTEDQDDSEEPCETLIAKIDKVRSLLRDAGAQALLGIADKADAHGNSGAVPLDLLRCARSWPMSDACWAL
jgi:hypothetical protein